MAHFERQLEGDTACVLGPGALEVTAVNLTGDRGEPVVSTSVGMSYDEFGNYPALNALLTRMNREVRKSHPDLPKLQPVALWANRLCLRANHKQSARNVSGLGKPRLERVFSTLLLQREAFSLDLRAVTGALPSRRIPNAGCANFLKPQGLRERLQAVDYIYTPLTHEEISAMPEKGDEHVFLLGSVGKTAVYGLWQQPQGYAKPIPEILMPNTFALYSLRK